MTEKLKEMQQIAKSRGGWCIAEAYVNAKTHIEWRCQLGHVWPAAPDKIRSGEWCPVCVRREPLSLNLMQELAGRRHGRCLATQYQNARSPLEWQCHEGHRWSTSPASVIAGSWCPQCAQTARLTLALMQRIARHREGRCLSSTYRNNTTPLEWQCRKGHRWRATPAKVKGSRQGTGTWCPVCARHNSRGLPRFEPLQLQDVQTLARDRGGECLAKDYINNRTPLLFRCAEGHKWLLRVKDLKRGNWCPHCAHRAPRSLDEMHSFARGLGGACLSPTYINLKTLLEWQCEEGHVWQATAANVLRGTWCPVCAGNQPLTIDELRWVALSKGGECLSKRYSNAFVPLRWRCAEGHTWSAPAASIKPWRFASGTWCPLCAVARRREPTQGPGAGNP